MKIHNTITSWQIVFILTIFFANSVQLKLAAQSVKILSFEADVRPILKAACFHCHGEEKKKHGGLDVRLVHLMKTGGESGAAIVPEKPDQSLLWTQIVSDKMPDGPKKLTPSQKQIIREWIRKLPMITALAVSSLEG